MDDRARALLKALIERYIADGQPVGSRTLSKVFDLSPATIRNVMADLEELGLIHSPHTSAGRVPTPRGYRMFVDSLLAVRAYQFEPAHIGELLPVSEPSRAVNAAAALLSNLTQFAGVVLTPKRTQIFRQIEFIRLSDKRVLLIIVTPRAMCRTASCRRSATTPKPSCWRRAISSTCTSPASRSMPCAARCRPNWRNCATISRA